PRPVETLFFGGGTPSHLPPAQLGRLMELVLRWHPLLAGGEFSIEANPLDVTDERAEVLRAHGVTRVSLGAQSFRAAKLALLERDHAADDIACAVRRCRAAGIRSVSLDLIFGTPGETRDHWDADLTQ